VFNRLSWAAGFVVLLVTAADAKPVCVACATPDATYACALARDSKLDQIADEPRVVETVCLKVLKKSGKHASCKVVKDDTAGCDGAVREIGAKEYLAALSDSDGSTKVEGLLPGAARVTGESLGKAGDAISGSAKSTWNCISSFFKDC
jgi:hypothetical protein